MEGLSRVGRVSRGRVSRVQGIQGVGYPGGRVSREVGYPGR